MAVQATLHANNDLIFFIHAKHNLRLVFSFDFSRLFKPRAKSSSRHHLKMKKYGKESLVENILLLLIEGIIKRGR